MPGVQTPWLADVLGWRPYPGRGVIALRLTPGMSCVVYFLTGRSIASQQRQITQEDSGDLVVETITSGTDRDALRHYTAVARRGGVVVAGNGSQVVPVAEALARGTDPLAASREHSFEPDRPIFTPRVWVSTADAGATFTFARAMKSIRESDSSDHIVWSPAQPKPGEGALITTYEGSADNVSTSRLPVSFTSPAATPSEASEGVWSTVHPSLRVTAAASDPATFPGLIQLALNHHQVGMVRE